MSDFVFILLVIVLAKSLLVGSEFSFFYWVLDGHKYIQWYFNRENYIEHRKKNG